MDKTARMVHDSGLDVTTETGTPSNRPFLDPEAAREAGRKAQVARRRLSKSRMLRAWDLMDQGMTVNQIAATLGVDPHTIYDYRKKRGNLPFDKAHHGFGGGLMDPVDLDDVRRDRPDVAPCLEDTPEGFRAFFEMFSPYKPSEPPPKDGLQPHNWRMIQDWWEEGEGDERVGPLDAPNRVAEEYRGLGTLDQGEDRPGTEGDAAHVSGTRTEAVHPVGQRRADGPPRLLPRGGWREQVIENVAPRMAKSEVLIWFCIWRIVLDRSVRIILISKTHMLSKQACSYIARVLATDADLQKVFGPFKPQGDFVQWSPSEGILDVEGRDPNQKEVTFRSRGSMQQLPGLGADWVIGDDVVTLSNSMTTEQRNKLQMWWQMEAMTRKEPGAHCFLIGTRVGSDDLYGRLLKLEYEEDDGQPEKLWTHVTFPALLDPVSGRPAMDGVSLWPERWTRKMLLKTKENLGHAVWEATYQQQPGSEEDRTFSADWLERSLDPKRHIGEATWPRENTIRLISIDPSPTKYAAAILMDALVSEPHFTVSILDVRRKKMGVPDMKQVIGHWVQEYGPIDVLIFEKNGFANWFVRDEEVQAFADAFNIRVIPHNTSTSKLDKELGLSRLAVPLEAGRIRFPGCVCEFCRFLVKHWWDEAVNWVDPRDDDDQLMATWFALAQWTSLPGYRRRRVEQFPGFSGFNLPPHLRDSREQKVRWVR